MDYFDQYNMLNESVQLDSMENLKAINYVVALPLMSKNKGLALMLNYKNAAYTTSIVQDFKQFVNYRYIKSFYVPFLYQMKLFNESIREKIDTTEVYDFVTNSKNSSIEYTYRRLAQYSNNNVMVGLYHYNELFEEAKRKRRGDIVINQYVDMMNKVSEELIGYDRKIMLLDLLSYEINPKDESLFISSKADNPLAYYIGLMQNDIETFKTLPYELLIVYGRYKIRIIPSECNKDSIKQLKSALHRFNIAMDAEFFKEGERNTSNDQAMRNAINDRRSEVDNSFRSKNKGLDTILSPKIASYNFTGEKPTQLEDEYAQDPSEVEQLENEINDKIKKSIASKVVDDTEDVEEISRAVDDELNEDEDFLNKLDTIVTSSFTNTMTAANTKRNKMLMKKQAEIKINKTGKTIKQILENKAAKELKPEIIHIDTLNKDMKTNSFTAFSKKYNEEMYERDIIAIFNDLSTKDYPVYILDIKKEDTSDVFNKKYTYTVKLETGDRERSTIKIDMPKMIDSNFMYLSGNKKSILTQFILLPISKIAPDTVKLCSNYNKIIVTRTGNKATPKLERIKKYLEMNKGLVQTDKIYYKKGNSTTGNTKYLTNIEYDELAKEYTNIFINVNSSNRYTFYFNQETFRSELTNVKEAEELIPVALKNNKEIIYLNCEKDVIEGTDMSLVDYMVNIMNGIDPDIKSNLANIKVGKRFMYTVADIMSKKIPIILLVSYLDGLTTVLKKVGIDFTFSDKRTHLSDEDIQNKGIIEFADGYLIYSRYPMKNSLLLDALNNIPTKMYNYADFDTKELYLDLFDQLYNDKKVLNAFTNFYDCFVDPKTREVLEDHHLPTDFVDILLYANELLQDNQYVRENHMSHYRIRNNEIPTAILSKQIAMAYSIYRSSVGNKHPKKINLPQDAVLKKLMTEKIVEDYSTLNPVLEAEKLRAGTFKGPSGLNVDRSYTLNKRAYDKSMKGIYAMSSPPSGSIGIVRQLPIDVNVTSTMGYLKIADSTNELDSSNMFCPSEALTPGTAQHDDGSRVAMVTSQSKHIVPVKNYSPLLIGNGAERALAQIITNDFAFKAKKDGVVKEIDTESELMVIEYKDKTVDIVDLSKKIAKNGGGGFYITNQLTTNLKVGSKVKEGDIVASNSNFFKPQGTDVQHKCGALTKVAIMSGYYTYEDSAMVTEKVSDDLTASVTMAKKVSIGKNSNISYIVKKGDSIGVDDPLIVFDESSEDESVNKLLANMSVDVKNQFDLISKIPVKSKYAGVIEDVKVYYTVDKSELSPSVQKVINDINKEAKKKRQLVSKYMDPMKSDLILDPVDKVETKYGKVKGEDVGEGVLIEFYITYQDKLGVADKITFYTALKTEVCKIIPKGLEPYSEYRPDEEIGAFISPISVLARMVKSIEPQMFGNKLLIELKRQMAEIYYSK